MSEETGILASTQQSISNEKDVKVGGEGKAMEAKNMSVKTSLNNLDKGENLIAEGIVKTGDKAQIGLWSTLLAGAFGIFETLRRRNKRS